MKIYSCETHINHALMFLLQKKKSFQLWKLYLKKKSYPQSVPTVKSLHYMLWRTNSRTQDVDKCCGYVYKFCL